MKTYSKFFMFFLFVITLNSVDAIEQYQEKNGSFSMKQVFTSNNSKIAIGGILTIGGGALAIESYLAFKKCMTGPFASKDLFQLAVELLIRSSFASVAGIGVLAGSIICATGGSTVIYNTIPQKTSKSHNDSK